MEDNRTYIIGIDPGLAMLGWGVIRVDNNFHIRKSNASASLNSEISYMADGVIETSSKDPLEKRLLKIEQSIDAIFTRYNITALVYEQQFFIKNVTSAMPVAHALGVVLLYAAKLGVKVHSFTPKEIKLQITGSATAKKDTVETFLCRYLGLDTISSNHSSDALGAAVSYFYKQESFLKKL